MTIVKDIKEIRPIQIAQKDKKEIGERIIALQKKMTPVFRNIDTTEIIRRMRKTRYSSTSSL